MLRCKYSDTLLVTREGAHIRAPIAGQLPETRQFSLALEKHDGLMESAALPIGHTNAAVFARSPQFELR